MLSRVAERVYWMARYLERTENSARLLSVHTSLLMDMPDEMEINWFTLVKIFNADQAYWKKHARPSEADIMHFLIADKSYPGSLASSLSNVRENVRTSLDAVPEETWEQVNQASRLMSQMIPSIGKRQHRQGLLHKLTTHCQCIRGILDSHMSRDTTFDFTQLGKHLERADMTSRILEMTSLLFSEARSSAVRKYEGILWTNLLQALSAHQMYLRHMRPPVESRNVLRFLIQNGQFPRSLQYSLINIGYYLQQLPNHAQSVSIQQQILEHLQQADLENLPKTGVHTLMDHLQEELGTLHQEIAGTWFYPDFEAQMQHQSQNQTQSRGNSCQSQSQSTNTSTQHQTQHSK